MNNAVSCRVRLARNCTEFAFSHRLAKADAIRLLARAERFFRGADTTSGGPFSALDGKSLERHFVSSDEISGAWVNHVDHFRIWSQQDGLSLDNCLRRARLIEAGLERSFPFAVSLEWGYLSPELDNLGTAMRASVLLHLPALSRGTHSGTLAAALDGATDSEGLELRHWGPPGSLLHILANRETLGLNEGQLLNKLDASARVLLHYEDSQAMSLCDRACEDLADSAWRALGILRNCRTIEEDEAFRLLGQTRLGFSAGFFGDAAATRLTAQQLNQAILALAKSAGQKPFDGRQRSACLREILA